VVGKVERKAKKPYGFGAQLLSRWDQLPDRVSIRNDSRDKIGCSISDVIAEVHSIPEITFGDDLYCFTTEYLSIKNKKEI